MDKAQRKLKSRSGMTLVEVMVSSALLALVSAGLISAGLASVRMAHYLRLSTEARAVAKSRMEALTHGGRFYLMQPDYQYLQVERVPISLGHDVELRTRLVWHDASGGVVGGAVTNGYAEVHVDAEYFEPFKRGTKTDTFSGIVR